MPIAGNRFFQDPSIGQAFENIAGMFAPPSAQDSLALARAAAEKNDAARKMRVYDTIVQPGASNDVIDRQLLGSGQITPLQTFFTGAQADATQRYGYDRTYDASTQNNVRDNTRAVQTNAADNTRALSERQMMEAAAMQRLGVTDSTDRRGQDLESGDRRYGTDVGAQTSIANNGADNVRMLADRDKQEAGSLARMYAAPIKAAPGERVFLPGQTTAATGLSPVLSGADKPLSETEWQAGQNERLRQSGQLSDQQLIDAIMGKQTPVEAVGPDGRTPVFMAPGAAVRTGAQPAPRTPLVNVNTGDAPDSKLRGKLDENEGKRLSDLQAAAVTASGLSQDLDLMSQLIEEAPQGPLVGRLAAALPGFSDAGTAFQSIVERAAPGLRVEGSGATSDIEFRGMLNSLPQLRNRPEANRLIAGMMKAKADINIRRGELVTAYQNGDIDASQMRQQLTGLNRQSIASPALSQMIDAVGGGVEPLTPDNPAAGSEMSPGTILEGHRFKGGDPADPANWELL